MADSVSVDPTPIQRNQYDVAVDLTKLYYERSNIRPSVEEIQETYAKFYAVACGMYVKAHGKSPVDNIQKLLPEILE